VTELEDVAGDKQAVRGVAQPVIQESPHPYTDDMSLSGIARIPGRYQQQPPPLNLFFYTSTHNVYIIHTKINSE